MDKMRYKEGIFWKKNTEQETRNCPIKLWGPLAQTFQQAAQTKFYKMDYSISKPHYLIFIWTKK